MATEIGLRNSELEEPGRLPALDAEPYRFEFFQAVRLLERSDPQRSPVGRFVAPNSEVVRFSAAQSLAFPASEIQSLQRREQGPPLMSVNFMGLTGPLGVLPVVYTTFVMSRIRERDLTLRDFFDIFNHRMISLFYRAWERSRFAVSYERDGRGPLSHHLLALIGLGTAGLQDRQAVADVSLIFYSGLLAQRPRSAQALRQVLEDYFDVPVAIEQFAGGWSRLAESDQCYLGARTGVSTELGLGAVVGDEVWYIQSRVRIVLGPLSLRSYLDFLPGGAAHETLRAFTRLVGEQELDFEVQLILKREEAPLCVLGEEREGAAMLGWLSWARSAPLDRDPADTILQL